MRMKLYLKASMKSWMHCTYDNNCSLWDTSLFSTILISMPTYTITHSIKIIWIFFLGIQDMPNCAYLAYSMQYLYHPICVFSSYGYIVQRKSLVFVVLHWIRVSLPFLFICNMHECFYTVAIFEAFASIFKMTCIQIFELSIC